MLSALNDGVLTADLFLIKLTKNKQQHSHSYQMLRTVVPQSFDDLEIIQ